MCSSPFADSSPSQLVSGEEGESDGTGLISEQQTWCRALQASFSLGVRKGEEPQISSPSLY